MAGQIAYDNTIGRMLAMQQNRSAQAGVIPVKVTQVNQQQNSYSGAGGGGAMNIDPNANMLPPVGMTGRGGYFGPDGGYGGGGGNGPTGPTPTVDPGSGGSGNNNSSGGGSGKKGGGGKKPPGGKGRGFHPWT